MTTRRPDTMRLAIRTKVTRAEKMARLGWPGLYRAEARARLTPWGGLQAVAIDSRPHIARREAQAMLLDRLAVIMRQHVLAARRAR